MKHKKAIIFAISILLVLTIIFCLYYNEQQKNKLYEIDEYGNKILIPEMNSDLVNTSHIIIKGNLNNEEYSDVSYTIIYTFNEEELIIQRESLKFPDSKSANLYYNDLLNSSIYNLSIENTTVSFNRAPGNTTKEKMIELLTPGENNTVIEMCIY